MFVNPQISIGVAEAYESLAGKRRLPPQGGPAVQATMQDWRQTGIVGPPPAMGLVGMGDLGVSIGSKSRYTGKDVRWGKGSSKLYPGTDRRKAWWKGKDPMRYAILLDDGAVHLKQYNSIPAMQKQPLPTLSYNLLINLPRSKMTYRDAFSKKTSDVKLVTGTGATVAGSQYRKRLSSTNKNGMVDITYKALRRGEKTAAWRSRWTDENYHPNDVKYIMDKAIAKWRRDEGILVNEVFGYMRKGSTQAEAARKIQSRHNLTTWIADYEAGRSVNLKWKPAVNKATADAIDRFKKGQDSKQIGQYVMKTFYKEKAISIVESAMRQLGIEKPTGGPPGASLDDLTEAGFFGNLPMPVKIGGAAVIAFLLWRGFSAPSARGPYVVPSPYTVPGR